MDIALFHITENLIFYTYDKDAGFPGHIFVSDVKQDEGMNVTAGEFGFIKRHGKEKQIAFKVTEEVYLSVKEMKDITDFMENLEKSNWGKDDNK